MADPSPHSPPGAHYPPRADKQLVDAVHAQVDAAYRGLLKLAADEPADDPMNISRGHKMLKAAMHLQRAMLTIKPLIEELDRPHYEMLKFNEMLADRARATAPEPPDEEREPIDRD